MDSRIIIGKVLKAQGLKGEMKVLPITDDISRFNDLSNIIIANNNYKVKSVRLESRYAYISLVGIEDRTKLEASNIINNQIEVERSQAISLEEGRYFIQDIVGFKIQNENDEVIGEIADILQYGSVDTILVKGKKNASFPFLKRVVREVNLKTKTMYVIQDKLNEVISYED